MINLSEMNVTNIQFFDYSHEEQIGENEFEEVKEYSANIILDEKLVIQLSGDLDEAHRPSIPSSAECYYNDEDLQDWACENLDIEEVIEFLNKNGIENNYYFLDENNSL